MQVFYIIAVFGLFATLLSSFVNSVSQSSIELKQNQVEALKTMFADVEVAINTNILGSEGSLACCTGLRQAPYHLTDASILEFTGWTKQQLKTDPWGKDIQVVTAVVNRADDYIDDIDVGVSAPVQAFALVSSGPNREMGTALQQAITTATSYRDVMQLEDYVDDDDIVRIFSTRQAMQEVWNRAKDAHQRVVAIAVQHYRRQYDAFLPQVQGTYEAQFRAGEFFSSSGLSSQVLTEQLNRWREDAAMQAQPGYPTMPVSGDSINKLQLMGADGISIPFFGPEPYLVTYNPAACGGNRACIARARETMEIWIKRDSQNNNNNWQIDYLGEGNLNGRVLVQ